jgi:secreted PhoX family phosphatase
MRNGTHCIDFINDRCVKRVKSIFTNIHNITDTNGDFDGICYSNGFLFLNHEIDEDERASVTRITYRRGKCLHNEVWRDNLRALCSMFITPWNTILTNEEHENGHVCELHPTDKTFFKKHDQLGRMRHERTIFVPVNNPRKYDFYTTDDYVKGGGFYKYEPDSYGDLSKGKLFGFSSSGSKPGDRRIRGEWALITDPEQATSDVRVLKFVKLEGLTYNVSDGCIYLCVSSDNVPNPTIPDEWGYGFIYKFDPRNCEMKMFLDCNRRSVKGKLRNPDNIDSDKHGNLYICEDKNIVGSVPNRLVCVNVKDRRNIHTIVQGKDCYGEMTGVTVSPKGDKIWCNWKNGKFDNKEYSELFEIKLYGKTNNYSRAE